MLAEERYKYILGVLSEDGHATTAELCEKLSVSPTTIRSDLNKLSKENLIIKTHGGAMSLPYNASSNPPEQTPSKDIEFSIRECTHVIEKRAISDVALGYIRNGQSILLDASSSSLELAKRLHQFSKLTVVTNGIYNMLALKDVPNITVILIGGIITKNAGSVEGLIGSGLLESVNADLGFVSARGFTLEEGCTDFNIYEIELKRRMLERCKRKIALLDFSKLENVSTASFADATEVDLILTDTKADKRVIRGYKASGIDVVVCPDL